MNLIWQGFQQAISMLLHLDPEVVQITLLSLKISGIATLMSILIGLPLGTWLALGRFSGRRLVLSIINTGMALPPVVVGLVVSIFLWRSGPLGDLSLIYTPTAIVIAQAILATPVLTGLTTTSLQQLDPRLVQQMLTLGASQIQVIFTLWKEARLPLLAALMAAFGSVISEIGASMMVGGNIKDYTRVLTTSIALETSRGNFPLAIALSLILLLMAYAVNLLLTTIQQRNQSKY
jgi:tungstate transport system permease protein